MSNTPKSELYERCIICGKLTDVPIAMPVDWRENYEVGCGQLCNKCAYQLREDAPRNYVLSDAQVLSAVEQSKKTKSK